MAVWGAACEIKRLGGSQDRWVCGWRLKMIPRTGLGGGADMYIRSPDMSPATMPDRHHTSSTSIRSFTGLLNKMRQRWESGVGGGVGRAMVVEGGRLVGKKR